MALNLLKLDPKNDMNFSFHESEEQKFLRKSFLAFLHNWNGNWQHTNNLEQKFSNKQIKATYTADLRLHGSVTRFSR